MIRTAALCAVPLLWALPASAQITADDVWSNVQAYAQAFGAQHTGVLSRAGDTVTVRQDRVLWELPMGFGTLGYALSDYTLRENGDGTVTITYLAPLTMTVDLMLAAGDSGFATLTLGPDDIVTLASGSPGAVSYATTTGLLRAELTDILIPGAPFSDVSFAIEVDETQTLTRIVEDTLTVIYSASDIGNLTTTTRFDDGAGFVSDSSATYAPARSELNMGLLPGGASILDLSGALRDGMYISAQTASEGSETRSLTLLDGAVIERSHITSGANDSRVRFDAAGLAITGTSGPIIVDQRFDDGFTPPVGFDVSGAFVDLMLPVLASPEPQELRYAMRLSDLRLGPPIWALFDPGKELDRSPFAFNMDVVATVLNEVEWLDVLSLEGLNFDNAFPAQIVDLTLADLSLSALGASFQGDAAFAFDNGDTVTYPGFPRPTGTAGFVLTGANTVLTFLGDSGLLPGDALFGFRMGLGMVTVPGEGTDVQTGRIELTPDGQIIANGQRLR